VAWANNIPVTQGSVYLLSVGNGGRGYNEKGGDSWFYGLDGVLALGGQGGTRGGGAGGTFSVNPTLPSAGGGPGGFGGSQSFDAAQGEIAGGGGGAGGYTGEQVLQQLGWFFPKVEAHTCKSTLGLPGHITCSPWHTSSARFAQLAMWSTGTLAAAC
jgi:hypothetical protein